MEKFICILLYSEFTLVPETNWNSLFLTGYADFFTQRNCVIAETFKFLEMNEQYRY